MLKKMALGLLGLLMTSVLAGSAMAHEREGARETVAPIAYRGERGFERRFERERFRHEQRERRQHERREWRRERGLPYHGF